ncbi:MAG: copper chaperone PCu(A)C [Ilumatobacteraceae bacterium]
MAAGCGGSDDAGTAGMGGVSIEGAWARATAAGQTTGAIYFDVTVDDDVLLDATVPASVASDAQLHEVVAADGTAETTAGTGHDMGDMDDTGDMADMPGAADDAMTMQPLTDGLELTAGRSVSFEPGSRHVMLVDLVEPLVVGGTIELTLDFQQAPDVTVDVEVRESAP